MYITFIRTAYHCASARVASRGNASHRDMPCVDGDSFVAYTTLHHLHRLRICALCPRSPCVIPSSASPAQPSQVGQVVQQAGHHHQAPLLGAGSHQRLSPVQALVKQARLSAGGEQVGPQAVGKVRVQLRPCTC